MNDRGLRIQPTTEPRRASAARALGVTAGLVLFDQISKFAAARAMPGTMHLPHNPAYAFGIASGPPRQLAIISIAMIVLVAASLGPLVARHELSPGIPALIAAGMLSNTIDRIRLGGVRDFIVTPWGIINVADLCVIAGIVALIVTLTRRATTSERAAA